MGILTLELRSQWRSYNFCHPTVLPTVSRKAKLQRRCSPAELPVVLTGPTMVTPEKVVFFCVSCVSLASAKLFRLAENKHEESTAGVRAPRWWVILPLKVWPKGNFLPRAPRSWRSESVPDFRGARGLSNTDLPSPEGDRFGRRRLKSA